MVQSVDHEEAGRLACQRLQRKAAFVLSRGEEFLSKFLPPLHEILVLAQATPLQVSLLESLQGFSDMSMNDLEAGRQILASPSLLAGEKWDLLRRGVHMPERVVCGRVAEALWCTLSCACCRQIHHS